MESWSLDRLLRYRSSSCYSHSPSPFDHRSFCPCPCLISPNHYSTIDAFLLRSASLADPNRPNRCCGPDPSPPPDLAKETNQDTTGKGMGGGGSVEMNYARSMVEEEDRRRTADGRWRPSMIRWKWRRRRRRKRGGAEKGWSAHQRVLELLTEREEMDKERQMAENEAEQRLKGEMYGAMQMGALILGVLYTAVADSTVLKCHDAPIPMFLAILVSIATFFGIAFRLLELRLKRRRISCLRRRLRRLEKHIMDLRSFLDSTSGTPPPDLDHLLRSLPKSTYDFDDDEPPGAVLVPNHSTFRFLDALRLLAVLIYFAISVVVAFSIRRMLCH